MWVKLLSVSTDNSLFFLEGFVVKFKITLSKWGEKEALQPYLRTSQLGTTNKNILIPFCCYHILTCAFTEGCKTNQFSVDWFLVNSHILSREALAQEWLVKILQRWNWMWFIYLKNNKKRIQSKQKRCLRNVVSLNSLLLFSTIMERRGRIGNTPCLTLVKLPL